MKIDQYNFSRRMTFFTMFTINSIILAHDLATSEYNLICIYHSLRFTPMGMRSVLAILLDGNILMIRAYVDTYDGNISPTDINILNIKTQNN